jgi:hypothetical protein
MSDNHYADLLIDMLREELRGKPHRPVNIKKIMTLLDPQRSHRP